MAGRFADDAPAPGPSQPPILGTDPSPWMTAEQIQQRLSGGGGADGRGGGGA
jgi:hypothetical protein